MILAIIFLVIFAACVGVNMYFAVSLVKSPMIEIDYKKHFIKNGILVIAATISFLVASFGFYMWLKATPDFLHVFQLVVGEIFFIGGLLVAINCFILHYYGRNINRILDRFLFIFQLVGFIVSAFSLFIYTNGLAPYLTYPLPNGISFTEGLVSPNNGSPNLAFYALCILSGAILVYFICDHYMYKEYGKHGILESTFFVAFPAGIIGARIWYVVGNWHEFAGQPFWHVFAVWEGGLTILGGAIMGIVVGVAWFLWRNKGKSIWFAVDMIVPTILIAQAVGRWGNFFNCEVHGLLVDDTYWKWLPEIIFNNAKYSSADSGTFAPTGQLFVPLFFIECISNLLGYFIIAHLFGKALGKYHEPGDLCFAYVIWYGLTRVLMEPLRDSSFQMGNNGYWSWVWSMVFVLAGTILIVVNHVVRYIIKKKKNAFNTNRPINRMVFAGVFMNVKAIAGLALLIVAIILMALNPFKTEVAYSGFNIGLICLVCGLSLLLSIVATMFTLFEGNKAKHLKLENNQPVNTELTEE